MDNSVYQPLSHALNPPTADPRPSYSHSVQLQNSASDHDARPESGVRHEEEEEEEEVEGAVDSSANADKQTSSGQSQPTSVTARRKPGRPKGSKNKKPRFDVTTVPQKQLFPSAPLYAYPQQLPPVAVVVQTPPPPPPAAARQSVGAQPAPSPYQAPDPSHQALYDFQWRVLSLCSEFYNAADELIRNTPQYVLHQCFSLPGNQVDPITLLHEARKACDQLMANPTAVVLKVPPQSAGQHPSGSSAKPHSPSTGGSVISNPGSFVMSLTGTPTQTPQQGAYNPPGGTFSNQSRYPAAPYYAYAAQPTPPGTNSYVGQQQVMKPVNLSTPSAAGNQGAWSDEETEKLKQLAEESKKAGAGAETGEIDWDWVVTHWGPGRTRHQILIKATNMNMKESSTRATKKRRENESAHDTPADHHVSTTANNGNANHSPGINGVATASVPNTAQAILNAVAAAASTSTSPPNEQPASSSASPVAVHPQQQPSSAPAPPGGGNLMHWPVPSPSPVISSGTLASRSVYYPRERNGSKA